MDKIIFHIDVNSAFLSWSAVDKLTHACADCPVLDIRTIPSIIGGDLSKRHGVVLAKSIPAKKYQIQTGEPIVNALRKCPNLHIEPPNHSMYEEYSEKMMAFLSTFCPDIEQVSIDECFLDYTQIAHRYSSYLEAANIFKNAIRDKFGFTVNVGISDQKILAKMASDFKKPDLVHTLFSWEIQDKLWPLPVNSLYMCGKSSMEVLHKLGLITIGDLAGANPDILVSHLKSHGKLLWDYANGRDSSLVETTGDVQKGIGNSTTLAKDIVTLEEAKKVLLGLCENVSYRLRDSKQLACMVSVEIKYNTFQSVSHQKSLAQPSQSNQVLYDLVCRLFMELWDQNPIRLLGVRTSKLVEMETPIQLTLFETPENNKILEKQDKVDHLMDNLRNKYGDQALVRGSLYTKK